MAHPRDLPSVSDLLNEAWVQEVIESKGRVLVTALLRQVIEDQRQELLKNAQSWQSPDWSSVFFEALKVYQTEKTQRAVNATGILLHTGLGRAILPRAALESFQKNLLGSTQLEISSMTGKRSQRDDAVGRQLCELFGGEAALVVNNNAAATLLVLHALSQDKEVVISRGELVEIGGSFRLPEIMIQSRAKLKEVGSTNKSRLSDFREAINDKTGLLMKAHTSNYKIVGFTDDVPIEELVKIGHEFKVPVVHDIGSGALRDPTDYGLPEEPLAQVSLKLGADLVFFSGDKLLGGPQSGIIVGKKKYVDMCRKNPLARALRVDKVTLLALEATLNLYRENMANEIPLYARLSKTFEELLKEAEFLESKITSPWEVSLESYPGEMGSGSMPAQEIPSVRLILRHPEMNAEGISSALRRFEVPVYGHLSQGSFGLNILSVFPEDHEVILKALKNLS